MPIKFRPAAVKGSFRRILCPVDFDANSLAALKFAAKLARQHKAGLKLLHVVPVPFEPSEVPVEPATPEWKRDARARLEKFAVRNLGQTRYKLFVTRGDPAAAILETERKVRPDLIVIATHGRKGFSHLVLGSVAERVVRESSVPVLTVRGRVENQHRSNKSRRNLEA
jgi:nucleotide-binding universal stress UspA family protein